MTFVGLKRREFITLVGGAAAVLSLPTHAQQPTMPVIGVLSTTSDTVTARLRAFRGGLAEIGYVEGQNVAIDARSADGQLDRFPALVADLIRRQVSLIAVLGSAAATLAAKAATQTLCVGKWKLAAEEPKLLVCCDQLLQEQPARPT